MISHRKVTLYGVRAREIPEDKNEREMRQEIRSLLPELFSGKAIVISLPNLTKNLCRRTHSSVFVHRRS